MRWNGGVNILYARYTLSPASSCTTSGHQVMESGYLQLCFFSPSALMASVCFRFPTANSRIPTDSVSALLSYICLLGQKSMYCTISAVNRDECLLQDNIISTFFGHIRERCLFGVRPTRIGYPLVYGHPILI